MRVLKYHILAPDELPPAGHKATISFELPPGFPGGAARPVAYAEDNKLTPTPSCLTVFPVNARPPVNALLSHPPAFCPVNARTALSRV